MDAETYSAYVAGFFYSGLYRGGMHYLESRSSISEAEEFLTSLEKGQASRPRQFERWYRNLLEAKKGSGNLPRLLEDLATLRTIGAAPLEKTYETVKHSTTATTDPELLRAAKAWISRMDTRVKYRRELGHLAYNDLLDLKLAERVYRSAVEASPLAAPYLAAWYNSFVGDAQKVAFLLSLSRDKKETLKILQFLSTKDEIAPDFIRTRFNALIEENPDDWKVRNQYSKYLERVKDYEEARKVIGEWLEAHDRSDGFPFIFASIAMARMYYFEGRYEEALTFVGPVVESGQGGARGWAARCLDKLGRAEEAEHLFRGLLESYQGCQWCLISLAKFLWSHDRYDEAARLLESWPHVISWSDWYWAIGKDFAEVFADRPMEDGIAAFSALVAHVGPKQAAAVVPAIERAGNSQLAFELQSRARRPGLFGFLEMVVKAYGHLKKWRGEEAALAWLREQTAPYMATQSVGLTLTLVYQEQHFELLWNYAGDPGHSAVADFIWLLRAAASLKSGATEQQHRELFNHYASLHSANAYQVMGRYLLGLATQDELLFHAKTAKRRCEIAYYLGVKAEADGRFEEASDWYRVAVETGRKTDGEFHWAHADLASWRKKGKGLSRLATEQEMASVAHAS